VCVCVLVVVGGGGAVLHIHGCMKRRPNIMEVSAVPKCIPLATPAGSGRGAAGDARRAWGGLSAGQCEDLASSLRTSDMVMRPKMGAAVSMLPTT